MGKTYYTTISRLDQSSVEADIESLKFCIEAYNNALNKRSRLIKSIKLLETVCLIISGFTKEEIDIISKKAFFEVGESRYPLLRKAKVKDVPEFKDSSIASFIRGTFDRTGFLISDEIFNLRRIVF